MECALLPEELVDYAGAAIHVLKENKLEIQNNYIFFSMGIFTKICFILDKTDLRLDAKKTQS